MQYKKTPTPKIKSSGITNKHIPFFSNGNFFEKSIDSGVKQMKRNVALPEDFQAKMESSFGEDFSNVKINKDSKEADELNALAFTQGNSIHFKKGEFDTTSSKGQELIAHELSHVVQQRNKIIDTTYRENNYNINDNLSLEKDADADAKKAINGDLISHTFSKGINSISSSSPNISQKKESPIQLRRILPSGAPLAELSIDSNAVLSAFETLWARRPDNYNSSLLFDTPDHFSDHPDLPGSIREICGGDYFRGNNYWSSGWVDDGDTDILYAGDADIKAEMTIYINNERTGASRTGTYGSTSSTTRERTTEDQTTIGGEAGTSIGGHEGALGGTGSVNAANQRTETDRMTVSGGSSLSMEIPSRAIRADVIVFLKISFRPSIWDPVIGMESIERYSARVGTLLLGAPAE